MTRRFLFLVALLVPLSLAAKPKSLEEQALDAMKSATHYMMDVVSYRGGFVWNYLPDFSRQWGEMEAKRTMVWTQSGTPEVGQLLLDAYHATGDEYYYQAAEQVARALIWGPSRPPAGPAGSRPPSPERPASRAFPRLSLRPRVRSRSRSRSP